MDSDKAMIIGTDQFGLDLVRALGFNDKDHGITGITLRVKYDELVEVDVKFQRFSKGFTRALPDLLKKYNLIEKTSNTAKE